MSSACTTKLWPCGGPTAVHDTVGGVVSLTVTFCVAVPMRPLPSVPVQVTTFRPAWNADGASLVIDTAVRSQTSAPLAMPML
jgi:hypothetical protein